MNQRRTFEATLGSVSALVAFVGSYAEALGIPRRRSLQLKLAVEEAAVNICRHAYERPPGEVAIALSHQEDRLTVELRDDGVPFDPLSLGEPEIASSLEDRQIGGLGIFLIGKVMDEVRYRRDGSSNVLTLVLYR